MESCDFLSHGSEETLRVEETSDPEHLGSPMVAPTFELAISFKEFCIPEPKSCGEPGKLFPIFWDPIIYFAIQPK